MAENVHSVIENWTGVRPIGCPWSAFRDPFTLSVLRAMGSEDLAWSEPDPSNRMVEAVSFYKRCANTVAAKRREQEREQQRTQPQHGSEVIRG
jgi:hypothetical protein